jgi:hypothetical protein
LDAPGNSNAISSNAKQVVMHAPYAHGGTKAGLKPKQRVVEEPASVLVVGGRSVSAFFCSLSPLPALGFRLQSIPRSDSPTFPTLHSSVSTLSIVSSTVPLRAYRDSDIHIHLFF